MIWLSHACRRAAADEDGPQSDDQVLRQAKGPAACDGVTLTRFVEDALRVRLAGARDGKAPFRMQLKSVKGDRPPNVDISDRDALYDVIDRS